MRKTKVQNKGITLIALIVTIIVMLLLVGVTISTVVDGGLFEQAGKAVSRTEEALKTEQQLASGRIQIGGQWYNSIDDYFSGNVMVVDYKDAAKDTNGFLIANATYTSGEYTAIIPKGYKVSEVEGEKEIAKGLVIKDANGNEFVWIPVEEDIANVYPSESNIAEPCEIRDEFYDYVYNEEGFEDYIYMYYDSQEALDHFYEKDYYNYEEDFKYVEEYAQMVKSVNENNGFYIGRYETTIDEEGKVGSQKNETVLTANTKIDNTSYSYRWYGLYYAQKQANVTGNGTEVQTAMIYGTLWDETMKFIRAQKTAGNTNYDVDIQTESWHTSSEVAKSAQANPGENGDVALNIWDLESNVIEWSQMSYYGGTYRIPCGGVSVVEYLSASATWGYSEYGDAAPMGADELYGTRLVMLLK